MKLWLVSFVSRILLFLHLTTIKWRSLLTMWNLLFWRCSLFILQWSFLLINILFYCLKSSGSYICLFLNLSLNLLDRRRIPLRILISLWVLGRLIFRLEAGDIIRYFWNVLLRVTKINLSWFLDSTHLTFFIV